MDRDLANSVLHSLAARKCHTAIDATRSLLRSGEKANAEYNGMTPLHVAALNDNLKMVQLLLHFGADPKYLDRNGMTPLEVATGKSREFLNRLFTLPSKKRQGILHRIFLCHSRSLLGGFLNKARKKIRRFASETTLERSSFKSEAPLPKDRHDPLPSTMIVEDDPLPLEIYVLPGTPRKSHSPSMLNSSWITTKRGGRSRARVISASRVTDSSINRVRCRSAENILLLPSEGPSFELSSKASAKNVSQSTSTYENKKKGKLGMQTMTPMRYTNHHRHPTPDTIHITFLPKKLEPSAPPEEPLNVTTDDYFTADESILNELESRIKQIKINDPDALRINKLTNSQLKAELSMMGISPGPITRENRKGYEKKLLASKQNLLTSLKYSHPLQLALNGIAPTNGDELDRTLLRELFDGARQFNYILLDPRKLDATEVSLHAFVEAVFYVGKGTGERPISHLIDAKVARHSKHDVKHQTHSAKIERIINIWNAGIGVIQLEIGKGVGDKLSLTRESCLMVAIGPENLTNQRAGSYHGAAASWDNYKRASYGTYLILRAHRVFNADRPQPIMPFNVPDQLFGKRKKN